MIFSRLLRNLFRVVNHRAQASAEANSLYSALDPSEIIDLDAIDLICQFHGAGHEEVICELIGLFLELAPKRIDHLKRSLGQRNWQAVSKEAHSLKSSCANLGVKRVLASCRKLEAIEKQPDPASAIRLISEIEAEYVAVARFLTAYLKKLKSEKSKARLTSLARTISRRASG
jgi:HPt (histidine-containing phosphotransfer) domain-containing protein